MTFRYLTTDFIEPDESTPQLGELNPGPIIFQHLNEHPRASSDLTDRANSSFPKLVLSSNSVGQALLSPDKKLTINCPSAQPQWSADHYRLVLSKTTSRSVTSGCIHFFNTQWHQNFELNLLSVLLKSDENATKCSIATRTVQENIKTTNITYYKHG